MSDNGGIGWGTIIFWVILANTCFFNSDDEKSTEVVVEDKPSVTEKIKEVADEITPELERIVVKTKKVFDEAKTEIVKEEVKKKELDPVDDDPFDQNDIYGSSEDKY